MRCSCDDFPTTYATAAEPGRPARSPPCWILAASLIVAAVQPARPVVAGDCAGRVLVRGEPMARYPHRSVARRVVGNGPRSYWLFEPAEPSPECRVPVVVFLHGWLAVNPGIYGAWIEHLTRTGAVVVYPRYQDDFGTPASQFLPNAADAVRDALDVLETAPGTVRPDRARFALVGHSAGGNLAAQLAASAEQSGIPRPCAVVAVMPGEVEHQELPRLSTIPADTLLVVAAGDRDWIVGDRRAREIYAQATAIPAANKEYVLYRSESGGPQPLVADHLAPTGATARFDTGDGPFRLIQFSRAGVDLLDRHGFWRLADLTLLAAFTGRTLDEASDHGAAFRDLGHWSNGQVVRPPLAGDDLDAIPRVLPRNGARIWTPTLPSSEPPGASGVQDQAASEAGRD